MPACSNSATSPCHLCIGQKLEKTKQATPSPPTPFIHSFIHLTSSLFFFKPGQDSQWCYIKCSLFGNSSGALIYCPVLDYFWRVRWVPRADTMSRVFLHLRLKIYAESFKNMSLQQRVNQINAENAYAAESDMFPVPPHMNTGAILRFYGGQCLPRLMSLRDLLILATGTTDIWLISHLFVNLKFNCKIWQFFFILICYWDKNTLFYLNLC